MPVINLFLNFFLNTLSDHAARKSGTLRRFRGGDTEPSPVSSPVSSP